MYVRLADHDKFVCNRGLRGLLAVMLSGFHATRFSLASAGDLLYNKRKKLLVYKMRLSS